MTKNQRYPSLLWQLIDEERKRKIKRFYDLLVEGKEFFYDPFQDKVYADLNMTLTDRHLGMNMLKYLDPETARQAERIMGNKNRSKRSRVLSVAKLASGRTIMELQEASEKAAEAVNLPQYIIEDLKNLKPTRITLFTDTPSQTVDIYKEFKLNPAYNANGKPRFIEVYATELAHEDGILTGEVNYIPDEFVRHKIQTIEHLAFLKRNIGLIA